MEYAKTTTNVSGSFTEEGWKEGRLHVTVEAGYFASSADFNANYERDPNAPLTDEFKQQVTGEILWQCGNTMGAPEEVDHETGQAEIYRDWSDITVIWPDGSETTPTQAQIDECVESA